MMERSELIMMAGRSNQIRDHHRISLWTIIISPSIPEVSGSNFVTLKGLIMKEIILSYMILKQMTNRPNFTHLVILVRGTEKRPVVEIRKGTDENVLPMNGIVSSWFYVELPRSNPLHQINLDPQLYLLGNILIRFDDIFKAHCNKEPYSESPDLTSEIRQICQDLDSGNLPQEWKQGYPHRYAREFVYSCLSHRFASHAFLADPKLKALKYIGAAGLGIATASAFVVPGLNLLGWGSTGVVAKSYAAQIQSGMGCVAKGSLFAKLQSVGATGGPALKVFSDFVKGAATIADKAGDHLRDFSSTPYLYLYSDDTTASTLEKLIDGEGVYYVSNDK